MPFYCSAFGCKNKDGKETRAKGISFHKFPSDKQRSDRWAVRLHRQGESIGSLWKPGNRAVVCSEHFLPSDFFWQWGRKLIKPDAEPTVFSFPKAVKRRKAHADRSFPTAATEEVHSNETLMADGGFLEIDQKLQKFLSEPLGHKLVTEIPGLEGRHADRLKTKGIRKAYVILGVFLALNKDKDDFAEWLKKAAATNSSETKTCYKALKQWSEKFI